MVETLKNWRKRWLSCGDTENFFRDNPGNQMQGVMQLKATKSVMPMKVAQRIDVSKFMSYIKVSRTQLNHIKRLKPSGDGIQTKHVSRVIGGLDKSHVKPYGALLEDEQRRLREHWLKMSCNDLPAFFEVLRERKVLMEKSRKLLGLELEQKNVSVLRKADQLTDKTKGLGQPGASENDGTPVFQNDQVECSPQSILQGGHDQSTSLQDQDDEQSVYHDLMVVRGIDITSQSEQKSDVPDQNRNVVSCIGKGIYCCANNPGKQSEVLMDIKLCKDGLVVDNPDCKNMQLEDLDGVSYKGPSVHAYEQDQDLESIGHAVVNHNFHQCPNISSEMSHPKMNTVIDQDETENVMIPSCSSSQLPKSSGEQMHVEDFLDLNDQAAKVEKVRWQLAGPLQSHFRPLENIAYNGSGDLQVKQPYLSSGQHNSSVYLNNGILSQQQPQLASSAFTVDNPASVIEPFSNLQSNGQLETAKDIGAVSYPFRHANSIKQSTGLHCLVNKRLTQSAPFPRLLQEQHQLIDQSDNGLYAQPDEDYYTDVSFPTKVNLPISEQHSYAAFDSMDHRYNWFPEGSQSHNNNNDNLLGLQSGNCLPQALPSGGSTDGTLFSAISQYNQPSVHMGHGGSSRSQLIEPRNQFGPPQNFSTFPDIYGFTQNMASGTSSQVGPVGSLDSSHWTNLIQQNPGMPSDFTNRPFRGPWTR
ncbi:hypothetical protein SORBI_3004G244900 [Sorghum bicolor]|nr:hypothetical protein SORBI_3004G244900 [Sorghum bicolor]